VISRAVVAIVLEQVAHILLGIKSNMRVLVRVGINSVGSVKLIFGLVNRLCQLS
jgi:hypothetical protein